MGPISATLASPKGASPWSYILCLTQGCLAQWASSHRHWRSPKGASTWSIHTVPHPEVPRPMGLISPTLASPKGASPWSYILCLTQRCLAQWASSHRHWRRPKVPLTWSYILCLTQRCLAQWASSHRHWRRPEVLRPGPTYCASPKGASPNGPHLSRHWRRPKVPRPGPTYCASPRGASPNGPYLTDTGVAQRCLALVLHTVPHPKVPRPMGLISPTLALPKGASTWSYILCLTQRCLAQWALSPPTLASPKGASPWSYILCLTQGCLAQWASSHRHWRRRKVPRPGPTYCASPKGASPNGPYLTDTGVAQRCLALVLHTVPHPKVPRPMGLISPTHGVAQRCPDLVLHTMPHPEVPRPMGLISPTPGVAQGCLALVLHTVPHPKVPRPMGLISPTLASPKGASTWSYILCLTQRCLAQWALSHRHWRRPKVPRPGPTYCASPKGASPNGPHLTDTGVAQRCLDLVLHTVPHPEVPRPMGLISPTLASPKGASPWSYILCLTQRCLAQWASSHRHWRRPKVPRPGPTYCASPRGASPNGPYLTDTGVACSLICSCATYFARRPGYRFPPTRAIRSLPLPPLPQSSSPAKPHRSLPQSSSPQKAPRPEKWSSDPAKAGYSIKSTFPGSTDCFLHFGHAPVQTKLLSLWDKESPMMGGVKEIYVGRDKKSTVQNQKIENASLSENVRPRYVT